MCLASIWCISSWVHFTVVDMTSFDPRVSRQTTKRAQERKGVREATGLGIRLMSGSFSPFNLAPGFFKQNR